MISNEKAKLESLGCVIGKDGNNFTSMNKSRNEITTGNDPEEQCHSIIRMKSAKKSRKERREILITCYIELLPRDHFLVKS